MRVRVANDDAHVSGDFPDERAWDHLPSKEDLAKMNKERREIWKRIAKMIEEEKSCPNFAEHNNRALGMPDGYIAREAWWNRMRRTHTQHYCAGCGTYAIWREKKR